MKEKLSYEFEIFYLDCMRQSKAGIFARSEEIETKKEIVRILKTNEGLDDRLKEKLLIQDNILEEAYRYVKDYKSEGQSVNILLELWLKSVAGNQKQIHPRKNE